MNLVDTNVIGLICKSGACPTILIDDHDCNLNNRSRLDVLSIVNNLHILIYIISKYWCV